MYNTMAATEAISNWRDHGQQMRCRIMITKWRVFVDGDKSGKTKMCTSSKMGVAGNTTITHHAHLTFTTKTCAANLNERILPEITWVEKYQAGCIFFVSLIAERPVLLLVPAAVSTTAATSSPLRQIIIRAKICLTPSCFVE